MAARCLETYGRNWAQAGHCFVTLLALLLTVLLALPCYVAYLNDQALSFTVLLQVLAAAAGFSLLMALTVPLLGAKYKYPALMLTALLWFAVIRAFALPGASLNPAGLLDWLPAGLLLLLCAAAARLLAKKAQYLSWALLAALLLYTGISLLGAYQDLKRFPARQLAERQVLNLSSFNAQKNMLVMVVSSWPGFAFEAALEQDPELLSVLSGFTLFSRAFTSFTRPQDCFALLWSGRDPADSAAWEKAVTKLKEDNFLADLKSKGFRLSLSGARKLNDFEKFAFEFPLNLELYPGNLPAVDQWSKYEISFKTGFQRLLGGWPDQKGFAELKARLGAGALQDIISAVSVREDIPPKALVFWRDLPPPAWVARPGDNESAGAGGLAGEDGALLMGELRQLISRLKEKDLYDPTLIVVVSAGGWPGPARPEAAYNILALIKPPWRQGPAALSQSPLWAGDLRHILGQYAADFGPLPAEEAAGLARSAAPRPTVFLSSPAGVSGFMGAEDLAEIERRLEETNF